MKYAAEDKEDTIWWLNMWYMAWIYDRYWKGDSNRIGKAGNECNNWWVPSRWSLSSIWTYSNLYQNRKMTVLRSIHNPIPWLSNELSGGFAQGSMQKQGERRESCSWDCANIKQPSCEVSDSHQVHSLNAFYIDSVCGRTQDWICKDEKFWKLHLLIMFLNIETFFILQRVMQLDLASLASVREFAAEYLDTGFPLHSLVRR